MKAAITNRYGSPEVLEIRDLPPPDVGEHDVLVRVHATPVTAGDRRLRTADFPSISAVPGRLVIGVLRPRQRVQGTHFAGRVVAVGSAVTDYAVGDDVFGSTDHGAYAEYLSIPEGGAMARMPAGFGYDEAAAVPYGAVTALRFLRDLGEVKPGDKVLILGASGGVGRFAVQIAKHLGATVTAVCGRDAFDLVRRAGADQVIDYAAGSFAGNGSRYDVIFDVAGTSSFGRSRASLEPDGRYLTLFVSLGVLLHMALSSMRRGPKAKFAVALGNRDDMQAVRALMEQGIVRPVIGRRYPLERIAEAHAEIDAGQRHASVMVTASAA